MTLAAYDFAYPTGDDSAFVFGLESKRLANELRHLADQIESEQVLPQKVTVSTVADRGDYPMTCVVIRYHEKRKENPKPQIVGKEAL